ncbi:1-acyl-sn-glycerol-3-phosphate acyltransferase [Penaeicola halotolerans]|uniref:1-acyl-sn-glycerol-3-phosphate acyltransferase n=1 Tax=Penaeicola halotolerans TaxID=2793196 RepID=UPI001CF85B4A|nr:1-acyl-sn-glycerol-3-phosphate acyltransferase [Penaeicola halotolerans]
MEPQAIAYTKKKYSPILPTHQEWPVMKLAKNRKEFILEVIDASKKRIQDLTGEGSLLKEELELTMYREKLRLKENPWLVDPDDEGPFWNKIRSRLVTLANEKSTTEKDYKELLEEITSRYTNEIASNFKPNHYKFTRRLVTFGFSRLLNASRVKGFKSFWSNQYSLQDKIHITGETEHIRKLAAKGTIVMVPTHFSNIDSILIGWVISTLGLPPFIYGAGLNLFNIQLFAYFMNSLGAYKVDRRKKNLVYIETLKAYSSQAIQAGCHSLFFPGGTRSRSGKIESKVKLGLLSTAVEAQRANYQKHGDKAQRVFIVPVTLNYHFVLEAPGMIKEYLKQSGQERFYVENDEYSNSYKIVKFLIKFFTKGSDISVSIGKPLDVLGNYVDEEGNSLDKKGRVIDTKDYFISEGEVNVDKQREEEYTARLGDILVKEYHRINRVFSSHIAAFTAFQLIKKKNKKLDLYNLLRLPEEDLIIPADEYLEMFDKVREEVFKLHKYGKVGIAPHLTRSLEEVMDHGFANVGMYHAKRTLTRNTQGDVITEDLTLLYFYHNRLDGYGLEKLF